MNNQRMIVVLISFSLLQLKDKMPLNWESCASALIPRIERVTPPTIYSLAWLTPQLKTCSLITWTYTFPLQSRAAIPTNIKKDPDKSHVLERYRRRRGPKRGFFTICELLLPRSPLLAVIMIVCLSPVSLSLVLTCHFRIPMAMVRELQNI
jgi:hypothetical protein